MKLLLNTLLEEFAEKLSSFHDGVTRAATFPNLANKIMVAIGMRRTGKTYFLWQTIEALTKNKIPLTRILYLNFEDDRLYPTNQENLRELLDGFYALFPENHHQQCYIFLDEIQNVENWHAVVRRYFDTKKVKLYLTGSSAKLLSKEIATSLRGRSFAIEIWPFNFTEFLHARQLSLPKSFGQINLDQTKRWLNDYLQIGGFPEVALSEKKQSEPHRQILQDYVSLVIERDLIERHRITNPTPLRYMIKFLLKNVGYLISVNKFYNDLKSQGFEISKTTVHDYLNYIEDAYLTFLVPIYSESIRVVQSNPKKIYAVDTGLASAYTLGFAQNTGHYFENVVYLDLRRARHQIYYYLTKNRQEVDFLTLDPQGKWHLFQVCWNMEDTATFTRENSALQAAKSELNIPGQCITSDNYFTDFLTEINNIPKLNEF